MNLLSHRLRNTLRLLMTGSLLLMLLFVVLVPRGAAMDEHAIQSSGHISIDMDCAAACASAANTPPPQAVLNKNETRTPDPDPLELVPYHQQFQAFYIPKKIAPAAGYSLLPGRPPDRVTLSGHFLL